MWKRRKPRPTGLPTTKGRPRRLTSDRTPMPRLKPRAERQAGARQTLSGLFILRMLQPRSIFPWVRLPTCVFSGVGSPVKPPPRMGPAYGSFPRMPPPILSIARMSECSRLTIQSSVVPRILHMYSLKTICAVHQTRTQRGVIRMRAIAFSLLCLISMAGMALSPPLYDQFFAAHQPTEPVAHGINIEKAWRKNDRTELENKKNDDHGRAYGSLSLRSNIGGQSQTVGRDCDRVKCRELDQVRLARAPPVE